MQNLVLLITTTAAFTPSKPSQYAWQSTNYGVWFDPLIEFGYDPDEVSGIAFGLGTTRMAAQWTGVGKVKSLYEQDQRVFTALHRGAGEGGAA